MDRNIDGVVELMEECVFNRGNLIAAVINLENAMDIFLAKHFCRNNNRFLEIIEMVFATKKFSYEDKRDTVCAIIKKHKEYKVSKVLAEDIYDDLKIIAKHRNIIAHCQVDTTLSSERLFKRRGIIRYHKYVNSKNLIPYEKEQLKEIIQLAIKHTKFINKL